QMSHVGHRHVIRKLERVEPSLLSVHRAGAESLAAKRASVAVDAWRSFEELFFALEEATVMVQVVDVYLESSGSQTVGERARNRVPQLGNELKRGLHVECIVEIHQLAAEIATTDGFDVVSHHRAAERTFRPEPDERNLLHSSASEDERHQLFQQRLDAE